MFATTVVVAWLLYSIVEHPFMRRFARSRRRPVVDEGEHRVADEPVAQESAVR
jgi:peptidoglycan/LPS O-acetylase OafA/YrhL